MGEGEQTRELVPVGKLQLTMPEMVNINEMQQRRSIASIILDSLSYRFDRFGSDQSNNLVWTLTKTSGSKTLLLPEAQQFPKH